MLANIFHKLVLKLKNTSIPTGMYLYILFIYFILLLLFLSQNTQYLECRTDKWFSYF